MSYGESGADITAAYFGAISSPCECGAKIGQKCVNPITGKERKVPCVGRGQQNPG